MNKQEAEQLIKLISKLKWPVPEEVFFALSENLIMCSAELAVLRGDGVLMFERNDKYFKGWHIPGTILIPGDIDESACERVITNEVKHKVSTPQFIDRFMTQKGSGEHEYTRGQVSAHLFVCEIKEEYKGDGKFFPLDKLPENTLGAHKLLIEKVRKHLSLH